jgi:hypothetical protein
MLTYSLDGETQQDITVLSEPHQVVLKPDDSIVSSEPFKDWDDNAEDLKLSYDETHQDITDLSEPHKGNVPEGSDLTVMRESDNGAGRHTDAEATMGFLLREIDEYVGEDDIRYHEVSQEKLFVTENCLPRKTHLL